MSLETNLDDAFTRVGTEFKTVKVFISGSGTGDVSGLTTTATNLVDAINEILALAQSGSGGTDVTSAYLADLFDVDDNAAQGNATLVYLNGSWIGYDPSSFGQLLIDNGGLSTLNVSQLADVDSNASGNGNVLRSDGTKFYGVPLTLEAHTDFDFPNGEEYVNEFALLRYDITKHQWVEAQLSEALQYGIDAGSIAQVVLDGTLGSLADVDLTNLTDHSQIEYDLTNQKWVQVQFTDQVDRAITYGTLSPLAKSGAIFDIQGLDISGRQDQGLIRFDASVGQFVAGGPVPLATDAIEGVVILQSGATVADDGTVVPTSKQVKAYADSLFSANDALVYKGQIDATANPPYPAADAGHLYRISAPGKIGGASGVNVELGDLLICIVDNSAAGTQAQRGANWEVVQGNLDGAVIGPVSSVGGHLASFSGTSGKIIADSGYLVDPDSTMTANSSSAVPTQSAVRTFVQNYGYSKSDIGDPTANFVSTFEAALV